MPGDPGPRAGLEPTQLSNQPNLGACGAALTEAPSITTFIGFPSRWPLLPAL